MSIYGDNLFITESIDSILDSFIESCKIFEPFELVTEDVKEFKDKVINTIKTLIQKIKDFIKLLKTKIKDAYQNIIKKLKSVNLKKAYNDAKIKTKYYKTFGTKELKDEVNRRLSESSILNESLSDKEFDEICKEKVYIWEPEPWLSRNTKKVIDFHAEYVGEKSEIALGCEKRGGQNQAIDISVKYKVRGYQRIIKYTEYSIERICTDDLIAKATTDFENTTKEINKYEDALNSEISELEKYIKSLSSVDINSIEDIKNAINKRDEKEKNLSVIESHRAQLVAFESMVKYIKMCMDENAATAVKIVQKFNSGN